MLATPRRQKLLEHIWQRTSLSRKQFASLYRAPLERYAELVQAFPASEAHHHAYPGGMLDHGLEIVAYSLKLRQSHLLPIGASPEDQAAQAEAWTAAVAYAALLHDIGKVAVDLHVELADRQHLAPMAPPAAPSRTASATATTASTGFIAPRQACCTSNCSIAICWTGSVAIHPCGRRCSTSWLGSTSTPVVGRLLVQPTAPPSPRSWAAIPRAPMAAPKHSLQRKLVNGLRYLLEGSLKLNQPEAWIAGFLRAISCGW